MGSIKRTVTVSRKRKIDIDKAMYELGKSEGYIEGFAKGKEEAEEIYAAATEKRIEANHTMIKKILGLNDTIDRLRYRLREFPDRHTKSSVASDKLKRPRYIRMFTGND